MRPPLLEAPTEVVPDVVRWSIVAPLMGDAEAKQPIMHGQVRLGLPNQMETVSPPPFCVIKLEMSSVGLSNSGACSEP